MEHSKNSFFRRVAVAGATLAGLIMFACAPTLRADDDCQRRVAKADHNLHEAIEHHGYQSEEAAASHPARREGALLDRESQMVG